MYDLAQRMEQFGYEVQPYEEKAVNIRNFVIAYAKRVGYRIQKALIGGYLDHVITDP